MSGSDESFDIFRDIKPYNFEPIHTWIQSSHLCHWHQAPVHNKSWIGVFVCVGISTDMFNKYNIDDDFVSFLSFFPKWKGRKHFFCNEKN